MNLNLRVDRQIFSLHSTIGRIYIDGEFECFTLEPAWKFDDSKPRAIPEGTYKVTFRFSQAHGKSVPHVEDVPGFEAIEIHIGNDPGDTKGCLLVGEKYDAHKEDWIGESGPAYYELLRKLTLIWDAGGEVWITYVNGANPEIVLKPKMQAQSGEGQ